MKVFLTGGTGYIGSAVLAEVLAQGHEVVAHARSTGSASHLTQAGAHPVVGDLGDRGWLTEQVDGVDAVVHAASPNDATSAALDAAVLDAVLPALAGTGRPYVHTGGVWIHGSGAHITEDSPLDPPPIVAWRPAALARVRAAADDGVRSVVVAPANVYGAGGGLPALVLGGPTTGGDAPALLVPGGPQHFSSVHVADLADLFALALTEAPAGSYLIGAGPESPTVQEIAEVASRVRGLEGRTAAETEEATRARLGPLAAALLLDQQIDATRARSLGWTPNRPSLLADLATGSYAPLAAGGGAQGGLR